MNVGQYIKHLRLKKELTQEEVGNFVGVQRAAVQKWECGKTQNIKRPIIQKLAELFDVPASSFIAEIIQETKNPTTVSDDEVWNKICSNESKLMLASWIAGLNDEQLGTVEALLNATKALPE